MTTAELDSYRIYYADIQQLLNEGFIEKIKQCRKTAERMTEAHNPLWLGRYKADRRFPCDDTGL